MNIYTGLGIGQGLTKVGENIRTGDTRRAEAKAVQAEAEARSTMAPLKVEQAQEAAGVASKRMELQLRQLQGQLVRDTAFKSFGRYEETKDPKYLNNFLAEARSNNNPFQLANSIARVDKLERSPEVDKILKREGIEDLDAFYASPDIANFVTSTGTDGAKGVLNLDQIYGQTGYTREMNDQQLTQLSDRAKKQALLAAGVPIEKMTQVERAALAISQAEGIPYAEAIQQAMSQNKKTSGSALERMAQQIAEEKGIPYLDAVVEAKDLMTSERSTGLERRAEEIKAEQPGISTEEAYKQARGDLGQLPGKVQDLQAADEVRAKIDVAAGGDFFSSDMTDPTVRRKVGPLITELEKLTGKKLEGEDKRMARKYRDLIGLGGSAGAELTDEETGLLDSMFKNFKKYFTDNVGVESTAEYETFRNVLRNALYGAALTQSEIAAFNKAAGSLGQQTGPVLQQLKVQMESVKRQLSSIYDLNDETVAYYYLGSDLNSVDSAIEQIDDRIQEISNTEKANKTKVTYQPGSGNKPGDRPSLEDIYKGMNQ